MQIIDIVLASTTLLGVFFSILFILAYLRERVSKLLIPTILTIIFSAVPSIPLIVYGSGLLEGVIPIWCLLLSLPVVIIVIYSLIKGMKKGGRNED